METIEIPLKTLEKFRILGRRAMIFSFTLIIIMLFHVLVDFFYHA